MEFKPFLYNTGKNNNKVKYSYIGQFKVENDVNVWDGLGLIYWDGGELFIGNWKDGDKYGFGLHRNEDSVITLSHYDNWDYKGPTVMANKSKKFFFFVEEEGKKDYAFLVSSGEVLEEIKFLPEGGYESVKKFDFICPEFEIDFPTASLQHLTVRKLKKIEGKNKDGNEWESYTPNGELEGICSSTWSDGDVHLGLYEDGRRNGFGCYLTKSYLEFSNFRNGSSQTSFICWPEDDECGIYVTSSFEKGAVNYKFYIDKNATLHYVTYEGKEPKEKEFHLVLPSINGDEIKTRKKRGKKPGSKEEDKKPDLDIAAFFDQFDTTPPKKESKDEEDVEDTPEDVEDTKEEAKPEIDYEEKLAKLIGLDTVKKQIKRIKAFVRKNKEDLNIHMCFKGNPGTGKTEVARLLAGILHKEGVLKTANLLEIDRTGLVGKFIGETGIKTHEAIEQAMGGVLFIDEAYTLAAGGDDSKDFGKEAIATLLKEMEDKRGKFCVILAGYTREMDQMIATNPGFKSRIQFHVDFPNYNRDELKDIAKLMLEKEEYKMSEEALDKTIDIAYSSAKDRDFANARNVRNTLDKLIMIQNERTIEDLEDREIAVEDVNTYMDEIKYVPPVKVDPQKVDFELIKQISENYDDARYRFSKDAMEEAAVYLQMELENGGQAEGSGFIISPEGVIATCAHCVEGCKKITANLNFISHSGKRIKDVYDTVIVGIDHDNDVAVIKLVGLRNTPEYYPLAKRSDKDLLPLTEIAMAGYPYGGKRLPQISFNEGMTQSVNPDHEGHKIVLCDLSGHGGNSGSGVISKSSGRVVGVFSGSLLQPLGSTSGVEEINYYRPIEFVWDILEKNKK